MERYQERDVEGRLFYFIKIHLDIFEVLDFTVDFSGSTNVVLEDGEGLIRRTTIRPHSEQMVARLRLDKNWSLKTKFKFGYSLPDLETQRAALAKTLERHQAEIKRAEKIPELLAPFTQERVGVYLENLQQGYVDLRFPPVARSLGPGPVEDLGLEVHWRRAGSGTKKTATTSGELFPSLEDWSSDVCVGQLGSGAFASVAGGLSVRPRLVRRLFVGGQAKGGLHVLRLCWGGRWAELPIDDFVPCAPFGTPLFAANIGSASWAALLEKATAKTLGGYRALASERPFSILAALSGCPVREVATNRAGKAWAAAGEARARGYIALAQPAGADKKDFLYPVVRLVEFGGQKLFELKNLWDGLEWEGPWSHDSPLWTNEAKQEIGADPADPGSLWFSEEDFCEHFSGILVGLVGPWEELRIPLKFITAESADTQSSRLFASRWACKIALPRKAKLAAGVHQFGKLGSAGERVTPLIDLGLALLKPEGSGWALLDFAGFERERQIFLEADLHPGEYLLVPFSAGVLMKPEMHPTKSPFDVTKGEDLISMLEDLFRKLDTRSNFALDRVELKGFFEQTGEKESRVDLLVEEAVSRFGLKNREVLTLDGFVRLFEETFLPRSQTEILFVLEKLGYTRSLFSFRSRPFTLTVHSDIKVEMSVLDALELRLDEAVSKLIVAKFGKEHPLSEPGPFSLRSFLHPNLNIRTYCVTNTLDQPSRFVLSFESARNLEVSSKAKKIRGKVQPGATEFVCHTQPVDPLDFSEEFDFKAL